MSDHKLWLEETLLEAGRAMRALPRAAPEGHRGWWPEIVPGPQDYKHLEKMKMPVDPDLVDQVTSWLIDGPLDLEQRKLIGHRYLLGRRRPWRKVGKDLGISHEYARVHTRIALSSLTNWLKRNGKLR